MAGPTDGMTGRPSWMLRVRQNDGFWDRWTHESGAVHVMNGDPAAAGLADLLAFGAHDFDSHGALASLIHAADHPTGADRSHDDCEIECVGERPRLDQWLAPHFIPTGAPAWGGDADTLETASRFLARAQYWRNLFNP